MTDEEIEEMEKKGVVVLEVGNGQSQHEVIPNKSRMYTHRSFIIGYNNNRIVEVNMTSSNPVVVKANTYLAYI